MIMRMLPPKRCLLLASLQAVAFGREPFNGLLLRIAAEDSLREIKHPMAYRTYVRSSFDKKRQTKVEV
jgi:hypothetical protein